MSKRIKLIENLDEMSKLEGHAFKSRAYYNASKALSEITDEDFDNLKSFLGIPGIGNSINSIILRFREDSTIPKLESMREDVKYFLDPTLYKVRKSFITKRIPFQQALDISFELKKILELTIYTKTRVLEPISDKDYHFLGSFRRKKSMIADFDILVKKQEYQNLCDKIERIEGTKLLVSGPKKTTFIYNNEEKTSIDITCNDDIASWPFAILHFTGSREFNIRLRNIAKEKGYKLNQYGLTYLDGNTYSIDSNNIKTFDIPYFYTEKEIFEFLEVEYVKPENR